MPVGHMEAMEPRMKCVTAVTKVHFTYLRDLIESFCDLVSFSLSDEKLYDAYVLYPKCPRKSQGHDVETLVLKILPEVLEKQCGYKLFIFGRDEFPGQGMF